MTFLLGYFVQKNNFMKSNFRTKKNFSKESAPVTFFDSRFLLLSKISEMRNAQCTYSATF